MKIPIFPGFHTIISWWEFSSQRTVSLQEGKPWNGGPTTPRNRGTYSTTHGLVIILQVGYKVGPGSSYKWSYFQPYKWPYKWVTGVITLLIGVITPFITSRGPTLYQVHCFVSWFGLKIEFCRQWINIRSHFINGCWNGSPKKVGSVA